MCLLAGLAVLFTFTGCEEGQGGGGGFDSDDAVLRVNCGATGQFGDKRGNTWQADRAYKEGGWGYVGGETIDRGGSVRIEGTDLAYVYQTERYSMSAYRFSVPNGKYTVGLLFAETYEKLKKKGERIYSVSINGVEVLPKLDLIAEAGGSNIAFTKVFEVEVTNGEIKIDFKKGVQNPAINGIAIAAGTGGKQRKLVQQGVSVRSE
jgi:hypothetical protein